MAAKWEKGKRLIEKKMAGRERRGLGVYLIADGFNLIVTAPETVMQLKVLKGRAKDLTKQLPRIFFDRGDRMA